MKPFDCGKGPSSADWLIASSIDVPHYTPMAKHGPREYIEGWLDGWIAFMHSKSGHVGMKHSPSYAVGFISGHQFGHGNFLFKKEYANVDDATIAGYRLQINGHMPKEDCRHSAMQSSDLCFAYMGNVTGYITQFEQLPKPLGCIGGLMKIMVISALVIIVLLSAIAPVVKAIGPQVTRLSLQGCGYPFMMGICRFGLSPATVKVVKYVLLFHVSKRFFIFEKF